MSKQIKLSSVREAIELVHAAETCDFDIDIGYNKVIVDGKSIIGVCSIDLRHVLTVTYDGKNPVFERILNKYLAA